MHPNVVSVFDIGLADEGVPFIVMELCDGEVLSTVIDGRGAMGVSYAVDLVTQVLAGLHAAHELGIVHRDLKPDNLIVVHPRPDQPIVKVLDFGIAQGVFGEWHAEDRAVFGTPEYMPPEQACGEPVDARADIYAAGVILYELLTGVVPFACDTAARTIARMLATRRAAEPNERRDSAGAGACRAIGARKEPRGASADRSGFHGGPRAVRNGYEAVGAPACGKRSAAAAGYRAQAAFCTGLSACAAPRADPRIVSTGRTSAARSKGVNRACTRGPRDRARTLMRYRRRVVPTTAPAFSRAEP